ncbi:MAG: HesA/MoeB/ThiF family protein [Thermodesulfobacteriota bacterium]|nr:HesA/MoeB/ThiF family protein [Thermodesulfobacteriota bacterium]
MVKSDMAANKNRPLSTIIADSARKIKGPARRTVRVIDEAEARTAARQAGTGLRQAYLTALRAGIWPTRYVRNAASLSAEEQMKLGESGVAVIGAGGLGATVLMLLARMGIGRLTIVDPDIFEESNLNRQITAVTETLGSGKAETARKMLSAVNPSVETRVCPVRLTPENAATILSGVNLAVDALDNRPSRLILATACAQADLPLVHAAVAGFEGQVITIFPGDGGLDLIYGPDHPESDAESSSEPAREASPEDALGITAVTPAIMGGLEAMETIKILLNRGRILNNRMLYVDLENAGFQEFSLKDDPDKA